MTGYPVVLDLAGRSCVVIGGGTVGERKVEGLLAAGAVVTVVSPELTGSLQALAGRGEIRIVRRRYRSGDLRDAALAFVATGDRRVAGAVAREGRRRRVWVNAADDPDRCDFILPSVLRRGPLQVAVATGGASPALARAVRERIDRWLPADCADLAETAAGVRRELRARGLRVDAPTWNRALSAELGQLGAYAPPDTMRERLLQRLGADGSRGIVSSTRVTRLAAPGSRTPPRSSGRGQKVGASGRLVSPDLPLRVSPEVSTSDRAGRVSRAGTVAIVGAGPGDAGLITVRGLELLRRADVVVHDRLVNGKLLDEAPPGARRVFAGKACGTHTLPQEEINALLVAEAGHGHRVVRLKGGDPFVFGRGGEEALALAEAGVPFEVVPGVTSAVAVPAAAGIPLTHRGVASSFAVVTGHAQAGGDDRVDWGRLARGVDTLVVLMGLANLPSIVRELLAHGRGPETPAALIERGTTEAQRTMTATLATLPAVAVTARLEAPVVVVIGPVVSLRGSFNDLG